MMNRRVLVLLCLFLPASGPFACSSSESGGDGMGGLNEAGPDVGADTEGIPLDGSGSGTGGASGSGGSAAGAGGAMDGSVGGDAAASVSSGGAPVAPGPEKDCLYDVDCAIGQRLDACCPGCAEGYARTFVRASRCVVGLGEPSPAGCAPSNCSEVCGDILCASLAGVMCLDGVCTAIEGPGGYDCARERAFCSPEPPTNGADCCNAPAGSSCATVCQASFFQCTYDLCREGNVELVASCRNGSWEVSETPCTACPLDCASGEACVVTQDFATTAECRANPCAPGVVDCRCGATLCDAPGASCDEAQSGGDVIVCPVAHSAGP